MADVSPLSDQPALDLDQILKEAADRWFRPPEVFEILSNHSNYHIHLEPPAMPPAGSLFLFDRKVMRYFRKDGHNWRKKKDGKTVKEAHEKLKVGGVEALHCYYAHGEDDGKFQRRVYWMLDTKFEHIVLVHYREVDEGQKTGMSYLQTCVYPGSQLGSPKATSISWSEQPVSPVVASDASNLNTIDWNECRSKFDDRASEYLVAVSDVHPAQTSVTHDTLPPMDKGTGLFEFPKHTHILESNDGSYIQATSCFWADGDGSSKTIGIIPHQMLHFDQQDTSNSLSRKLIDSGLNADKAPGSVSSERFEVFSGTQCVDEVVGASSSAPESNKIIAEAAKLNKLDSFDRWMDREIGDDSLMATVSANYWNGIDTADDDKEVSSLSPQMQLDTNSIGASLSGEQLFSISDIAPAWAYSGVETKVLIVGVFLGDKKASDDCNWCCMFGEIEVSCDVLFDNMIRCQVPFHAVGRVPFYLTCGNRIACSEVLEFEFLKKPLSSASPLLAIEEVSVQIRLAKLLSLGLERKCLDCNCDKCKVKTSIRTLIGGFGVKSQEVLTEYTHKNFKDIEIEHLLKDKLYEWLANKAHEGDNGPHVLDDEGQGVIHLTASLGYVWALAATIASGVSPNFRDKQGRTSLHWASYFGRERAVITLIKLGAAASAVDDPTAEFPGGRKAADLASERGHKGIAGYLAEADLTSHLLLLSINEDVVGSREHATNEAERALQIATREVAPRNWPMDEDVVLKGSLAAVRKSALAAAMIQAAFRAHSFRLRQCSNDDSDLSLALSSLNKVQKIGHFHDYLHSAASMIQHKYRGWKGRKDFLRIRTRIVKLQAHVRGYQVRKQYKKVVWSVSVVEKAILRWRRKKPGLRGFQAEDATASSIEKKKDEYEYLRIGRKLKVAGIERALARVKSMVRHPEARNQYMRLMKLGDSKSEND